ncbi:DUF397 domain-containing protein [Streptomyces aurantiacus]|uniref:DUF397 domain-containing protein n=1 Tax=Streptomyces aurantiacus JA 4570 TaxID=1286094 RepID=S4AFG8_9ACTN|nr:DUF397 domain-containing protein [Streptomyces aurantiacus]EPH40217.1 hypothetical protein STRAU_6711 [Streptomyces aurantiacus JA 4570]
MTLKWVKSSYSTADEPACVEVAATPETIHIRDSKNPDGPQLAITSAAWGDFLPYTQR